jgi:Protein of unknown function (DUF2793).
MRPFFVAKLSGELPARGEVIPVLRSLRIVTATIRQRRDVAVSLTPNLALPFIQAAQSQKHVTHNEAIRILDAMVQLGVLDRHLSAPPASPAEGARYVVAASPTGAWTGHAGKIAAYQDAAWAFYAPQEGWLTWVADEDIVVAWNGSDWVTLPIGSRTGRRVCPAGR